MLMIAWWLRTIVPKYVVMRSVGTFTITVYKSSKLLTVLTLTYQFISYTCAVAQHL